MLLYLGLLSTVHPNENTELVRNEQNTGQKIHGNIYEQNRSKAQIRQQNLKTRVTNQELRSRLE